jgi:hypothetical protein
MKIRLFTLLLFICFGNAVLLEANPAKVPSSLFQELQREGTLKISIETDLQQLVNQKTNAEYIPGVFKYSDPSGQEEVLPLKVKTRGKFRRGFCDFPPLKLKFSKKDLSSRGMATFNKLKLVTHCIDDPELSKDYILREYLAYRLYNQLTDNSYRVQLVEVSYFQSGEKTPVIGWGFLIEPTSELAARLGAEEEEDLFNPQREEVDISSVTQVQLFQYMIGNSDWSIQSMRNVKAFRSRLTNKLVLVPYDFDFSGLVSTHYARTNPSLGVFSIRDRVWIGYDADRDLMKETFRHFKSQKKEMQEVVKSLDPVSKESRKMVLSYLDEFFFAGYSEVF